MCELYFGHLISTWKEITCVWKGVRRRNISSPAAEPPSSRSFVGQGCFLICPLLGVWQTANFILFSRSSLWEWLCQFL